MVVVFDLLCWSMDLTLLLGLGEELVDLDFATGLSAAEALDLEESLLEEDVPGLLLGLGTGL